MAKIVIVEDDSFLAQMYASKLKLEGHNVLLAADGEAGLALVARERPQLVLLDIMLPKKDGFFVLEEVRKTPALAQTPIILLTNLSQRKDVDRGLSLGANDYLIKSHFVPTEVVAKVNALLGVHD